MLACAKPGVEKCDTAADCVSMPSTAFSASCVDGVCLYSPIPGARGNGICDPGENKCTAPEDCGVCSGKVPGSTFLTLSCVGGECLPDVSAKPVYLTNEVRSFGDKFVVESTYASPFNMKKDLFNVKISLGERNDFNSDHRILGFEMKATTPDRRVVVLANQQASRLLWQGQPVSEDLILDFPSQNIEGELSNLILTVSYSYTTKGNSIEKSFQVKYPGKFVYVRPDAAYPCPKSCDDGNLGTKDYCGPQTNFFCKHEPVPGVCGNYVCDGGENKCTCPQDCGPCAGSAGRYVDYACKNNECVGSLKPGVTIIPNSVFDERRVGPVQLTTKYNYNDPFNVKADSLNINFIADGVFTIETVRLLERSQILGEKTVDQPAGVVDVVVNPFPTPEEEHTVTVGVWYSYPVGDQTRKGHFTKSLGKISFIDAG